MSKDVYDIFDMTKFTQLMNVDKALREIECDSFGLLRGALFPMKHVQISPELKAFHVEETRKHLFPNMDKALAAARRLDEFFK